MAQYYINNGTLYAIPMRSDELYHYGVPGMKWGQRKKYNPVGTTRTARRSTQAYANAASAKSAYQQAQKSYRAGTLTRQAKNQAAATYKQAKKAERNTPEAKAHRVAKAKRAAKVGAAVAATALAAYGAYKLNKYVKTKNSQIAAERGYKEAERLFKGMSANASSDFKAGRVKSFDVSVDAGAMARGHAKTAANDNFRTAARNVINYKKSGNSLKYLQSVDSYDGKRLRYAINRR